MKKFLKSGLSIILIFTIIFVNYLVIFGQDISPAPNLEEPKPKIRMGGDGIATVIPGKENTLDIPIINTSQSYAYNLLIQAKPEKTAPFSIKFLNNSNRKSVIERVGSTMANMVFDVDKNAPSGTYAVTLEFSYNSFDNTSLNNSDTLYIKIENADGTPSVVLDNFSSSKNNVVRGEQFSINTTLKNTGKVESKNLSVQILGLDESNITLVGEANSTYIQNFEVGASRPMSFDFATSNLTKEGSNKINFKVTYSDLAGKEYSREFQYYILVSKSDEVSVEDSVDIKITSLISPKGNLNVNQSGTFTMKIKNDSKVEAKNIKITAKVPEGVVPTSSNVVVLSSIPVGAEKTLTFSVAPNSSSKTQAYSVGFLVEYTVNEKQADGTVKPVVKSFEQYGGINAYNPNENDKEGKKTSVPKIIISRYEATPMIVEAGKPFDLSMTFKNTHSVKTVKNIKLYLTVEDKTEEKGNVFAPDNSSTTFYIPEIAPNQEVKHKFDLFTVPDAKPRSYTINVNFEYEDEDANEFKTTELVGINVKQQSKLETSDITVPTNGNVGEPIYINFQLFNTGKVVISNLKVEMEGEGFNIPTSTVFVGNIEPGNSDYYDGNFTPTEAGDKAIKLKISYTDTDGKTIERNEEYKIKVEEIKEVEPTFNQNIPPEVDVKSKFNWKILAGIVIVVLIVLVVLFLYLKKRARLKKEFDFNE